MHQGRCDPVAGIPRERQGQDILQAPGTTLVRSCATLASRAHLELPEINRQTTECCFHRHSTSTLCHEAALAVIRVKPDAFWDYSLALLADQDKFYDIPSSTRTPIETRESLVQLGVEKGILDEADAEEVKDLLAHKSTPNGGNAVTNDLKWCGACLSSIDSQNRRSILMIVTSQVRAAEPHPFFAHYSVGRNRGTQRFELMGREGMVSILCKQDCSLSVTPMSKWFKIGVWFKCRIVGKF